MWDPILCAYLLKQENMRTAFTLIEIMVGIILLAILASMTMMMFFDATEVAANNARKTDLNAIMEALEAYRICIGNYPGSLDELLVVTPATGPLGQTKNYGPWLKNLGVDPVDKQPYTYIRLTATSYTLEGDNVHH